MLICTNELHQILNDPNLLLIDARSFKEYSQGHIPGAVNLDVFAYHWFDTSNAGMQAFNAQSKELFSFVGVTNEKKVVFYDDISGILASRGVWELLYFSHPQVFMLDGGITKWKSENLPIENKSNEFKPAKFSGKINTDIFAGFEYIRDNLKNLKIIDARTKEEYEGKVVRAAENGTQTSNGKPTNVPRKRRGATPTRVNGWPLTWIVLPMAVASAPKLRCQRAWLMTATCSAPRPCSSGGKKRPSAGRVPSTAK